MKVVLITALAVGIANPALTQTSVVSTTQPSLAARIAAMPKDLPRAKGPSLEASIKLAIAAVEACKARGGIASVLVTDSSGVPIVLLSGDGAGERSQLIAISKANTAIKYQTTSTAVKQRTRVDARLAREISLDPNIGEARLGAFPLMEGSEMIGALAVSGLTGQDDNCAKDALAKVVLR